MSHLRRDVAIVGVHNTVQERRLPEHDATSIAFAAAAGALADAGLGAHDLDGAAGGQAQDWLHQHGVGPAWCSLSTLGITVVLEAAWAIASGAATTVLVLGGNAGHYTDRSSTAPWTVRPDHEFVAPFGMMNAAHFAFSARRHMHEYGTTPEALATVAATIRNNGHVHPGAVYRGRGPFTAADVLASRMVADPFRLLDCAMTSEGGCALVLTTAERAADLPRRPVFVLAGGTDHVGPSYRFAPRSDLGSATRPDSNVMTLGRRAWEAASATTGVGHDDVDVLELYDPFSFEVLRQLEAFGFCEPGEAAGLALAGELGPGGRFPVTTDGGLLSYSHPGVAVQKLQRVIRGVEQLRGTCTTNQVPAAEVALCTGGGSGALYTDLVLLGVAPR